MPGRVKAPAWLPRKVRLFLGPSALRRASDRMEGIVVVVLLAAFGVAVSVAAITGMRFFQTQDAQAARLSPAVAVVSPSAAAAGDQLPANEATARWQAPDGRQMSGILTTDTAPDIWGAPPGTRVTVWLTSSGVPVPAPPGPAAITLTALVIGGAEAGGAGIVLSICYLLCRVVLDHHRLAGWEADWELTGPRWTTRR